MSSYELPTNVNPADIRFSHTCTCGLSHRIAAFGAIRRAAEVARTYDAEAQAHRTDGHGVAATVSASIDDDRARVTRAAIRAAIGSPKA